MAIFVGFFVWLDGYKVFFNEFEPVYLYYLEFFYLCFWLISLCFLFKNFLSIDLFSKFLVFFFALGISIEFWILIYYNTFSIVCFYDHIPYTPLDKFFIIAASIFPLIEVLIIIISLLIPRMHSELDFLTNIMQIKNVKISKNSRFFEIWTSFPLFYGIYHVFIVLHEFFILKWCHYLSSNTMFLIALPWVTLLGFYLFYCMSSFLTK